VSRELSVLETSAAALCILATAQSQPVQRCQRPLVNHGGPDGTHGVGSEWPVADQAALIASDRPKSRKGE
jgi:hypothetical protein